MKLLIALALTCAVASAAPRTVLLDANALASVPRAAAAATQVPARAPRVPAALAGGDGEKEKLYRGMLETFEQAVAKQKLPRNDVAVAAAMFVTGAYTAYRGGDVGDAAFLALVDQLRDLLAATPAFAKAAVGDKQDMYEVFAITGTVMAVGAKTKRDDVKAAGQNALATLFGDADAVRVGERGLVVENTAKSSAPPQTPAATGPVFPSSKIVGIWWDTEMVYEAFPSNSMVMREHWTVLLSDKTCTNAVPSTLVGWNPTPTKCTWRKKGNGYELSWGKGWSHLKGTALHGFGTDQRLDGTWSRQRTGSVGTSSTWSATTLTLRRDGRFELSRGSHFTSSTTPRPGEVVVSGTGGKDRAGTYKLDGYLLELTFDSGVVEQHLFAADDGRGTARLDGQVVFGKE